MPPSQIPRGRAIVPCKVGKARRRHPIFAARAAFVSSNGVFAPEVWDPGGAASLPIFTRCCRTKACAAAPFSLTLLGAGELAAECDPPPCHGARAGGYFEFELGERTEFSHKSGRGGQGLVRERCALDAHGIN